MISWEQIRELADFQVDGKQECALSFYLQPQAPQNKSHRHEGILARDIVRNAQREIRHNGKNAAMAEDLRHILQIVEDLRGNQTRAKAIFACRSRNFWREFDLAPHLPASGLSVSQRFHLRPLLMMLGQQTPLHVVVLDQKRARFFDLNDDEIHERDGMFRALAHRGRGDGWHGYDGGHSERSRDDDVMHHFRDVASRLKEEAEKGIWKKWVAGCLDVNWHNFAAQLHPQVKDRLIGRFSSAPEISVDEVRESAKSILHATQEHRNHDLVKRVLSFAKSHKRGVTGLRRVLRSLELGEVQVLLVAENYSAHGVECVSCGRLDAHLVRYCALCGRSTRRLNDILDALLPIAIRKDIEVVNVKNQELEQVGNIAALLRFRSTESSASMAEAS